jgi:hypothetical protein
MCIGSFIAPGTPSANFHSMQVLTAKGIREKHKLTPYEFEKMVEQLCKKQLGKILFHYPDGPRYDIVLNLIATLG